MPCPTPRKRLQTRNSGNPNKNAQLQDSTKRKRRSDEEQGGRTRTRQHETCTSCWIALQPESIAFAMPKVKGEKWRGVRPGEFLCETCEQSWLGHLEGFAHHDEAKATATESVTRQPQLTATHKELTAEETPLRSKATDDFEQAAQTRKRKAIGSDGILQKEGPRSNLIADSHRDCERHTSTTTDPSHDSGTMWGEERSQSQ